jgi:RimJ/RimL family protein N-acetyltransferase
LVPTRSKISAAHRGQGFAREAMDAACAWLDESIKAERSVYMIDPSNGISCRLAGKLGFSAFAEAAYKGHPLVLYERLRGVWDLPLTPALSA